jgi:hypothetical protein
MVAIMVATASQCGLLKYLPEIYDMSGDHDKR